MLLTLTYVTKYVSMFRYLRRAIRTVTNILIMLTITLVASRFPICTPCFPCKVGPCSCHRVRGWGGAHQIARKCGTFFNRLNCSSRHWSVKKFAGKIRIAISQQIFCLWLWNSMCNVSWQVQFEPCTDYGRFDYLWHFMKR